MSRPVCGNCLCTYDEDGSCGCIKEKSEMNITVSIIKENEDGSADAQIKFDKEGLETLVQWGLVSILTKGLDEYKPRPEKVPNFPVKRTKK